jgi:hypothetical protein
MILRTALLSMLTMPLAVASAAAWANGTSSLTLLSTPPGVAFRIRGDQEVSGRAPVTLEPWLPGRYRVTGSALGYEGWRRDLVFDGMTADTLWIALRRKNLVGAGSRALVLPAWGQFYDQHPRRGWMVLVGAIVAGAGIVVTEQRYRDRLEELDAANAAYGAAQTPAEAAAAIAAWDRIAKKVRAAHRPRQAFIWAGASVWGLGVVDAVAFVPRPERQELLGWDLEDSSNAMMDSGPGGARIAMTLARVRF